MLNYKKTNLGKNTFQFEVFVPKNQIEKKYEEVFNLLAKELEVPGFRKGKTPKEIAKQKIKKETVYQELIKRILPEIYQELLKQENLKPFVTPKIELLKAKEGKDWQIRITVAEKPKITLPDYKKIIKNLKAEEKKKDIWVPGKTEEKKEKSSSEEETGKLLNKIFDLLIKSTKIEISELIIEEELEKRLTRLVDDIRKIGLTVEAYLKSKNETIETIKRRFTREIEDLYKLELALDKIADLEKITVNQTDLDLLFKNIKDEKDRQEAIKNSYFYASILRRKKTIDFILSL